MLGGLFALTCWGSKRGSGCFLGPRRKINNDNKEREKTSLNRDLAPAGMTSSGKCERGPFPGMKSCQVPGPIWGLVKRTIQIASRSSGNWGRKFTYLQGQVGGYVWGRQVDCVFSHQCICLHSKYMQTYFSSTHTKKCIHIFPEPYGSLKLMLFFPLLLIQ